MASFFTLIPHLKKGDKSEGYHKGFHPYPYPPLKGIGIGVATTAKKNQRHGLRSPYPPRKG